MYGDVELEHYSACDKLRMECCGNKSWSTPAKDSEAILIRLVRLTV